MKELFLPYHLALLAKEKEFNEPCFARYRNKEFGKYTFVWDANAYPGDVIAPLYQQIIDWFRRKGIRFMEYYWDGEDSWGVIQKEKEDEFAGVVNRIPLNKAIEEAFKLI